MTDRSVEEIASAAADTAGPDDATTPAVAGAGAPGRTAEQDGTGRTVEQIAADAADTAGPDDATKPAVADADGAEPPAAGQTAVGGAGPAG